MASIVRADELDVVLARAIRARASCDGEIERRLAADGRQQRVGLLVGDDRLERFPASAARRRCDPPISGSVMIVAGLLLTRTTSRPSASQRLARLRAGVVELARLADHDRAGADDEDAFEIGSFGHGRVGSALRSPFYRVQELAEQVIRVVRSGRGLGMVLHQKTGFVVCRRPSTVPS